MFKGADSRRMGFSPDAVSGEAWGVSLGRVRRLLEKQKHRDSRLPLSRLSEDNSLF